MLYEKAFGAVLCIVFSTLWQDSAAQASEEGVQDAQGAAQTVTNSIGMKLRRIEPGSFMMGSEKGEQDEKPVHQVTITRPFYVGICEVTNEQYQKVMGESPSRFWTTNGPVESVSWEDAKAFCRKLSELENAEYRLPTEAEWEYACRAGTQTVFHWGDSFDTSYFWCAFNSASKPHEVGKAKPNPWGLHDMSGNVWEWCEDWYAIDAYASSEANDPQGPATGARRVVRGGSWAGTPEDCRSANRMGYRPNEGLFSIGFRVCKVIP
jgi:formylglycine-generating enzyme required for sulfatase activity